MAPGWERRDVKVWNFRLWRLQWTMGLQEHRQGILFGRLSGCPGLQSQSPLWLWALVCPLGSPTTGQPLVRWKEEVRTLVRQPGRDPCGGERSMGRRHSVHPGVSRGVQPLLHSHLQQHVSTEGRQTCSNSQQGKLQFCQWSLIIDNKNFLVYIYRIATFPANIMEVSSHSGTPKVNTWPQSDPELCSRPDPQV